MLSAVAARKARLQDRRTTEDPTPSPSDVLPAQTKAVKPPKRRAGHSTTPSSKKAKTSSAPLPHGPPTPSQPRQVAGSTFDAQADFMLLDDAVSAASSSSETEHPGQGEPLVDALAIGLQKKKRAWSPSRPLSDSSYEESDDGGDNAVPTKTHLPHGPEIALSFRPAEDRNMFLLTSEDTLSLGLPDKPSVAVILPPSVTVSFVGVYRLRILRGSVSLLGVTLRPTRTSYPVFAPRSSPIPIIQASSQRGESNKSFVVEIPDRIASQLGELDSLIVVQDMHTGVEDLGRVVRTFDNLFTPVRVDGEFEEFPLSSTYLVRGSNILLKSASPDTPFFRLPRSWESALNSCLRQLDSEMGTPEPMVSLVQGSKNSGKSTFARTLLNRLTLRFRRVAFLECDIGQSEFTPGGIVALTICDRPLFGPPFTHPTLSHQAHYIGSTSPRSSPSHYLSAIQAIMQNYRLDLQFATSLVDVNDDADSMDRRIKDTIPLVVNTMGWTKGLGADLSLQIKEIVEPSHVFDFEDRRDGPWSLSPPTSELLSAHTVYHSLDAVVSRTSAVRFTAADHRTIALMSYFHALFPAAPTTPLRMVSAEAWDTRLPLCAQAPYEVNAALALDEVILTGGGSEDVVPAELLRVLNIAIVGLVHVDAAADRLACTDASSSTGVAYTQGAGLPDPANSTCSGLALVRGVSFGPPTLLHMVTPLPAHLLATSRVLIKGDLELPVWGLLDHRSDNGDVTGVDAARVPYLRWGKGSGVGGERRRARRNLMRKGQM
ncbi:hypothetical protein FA95DRAFT_1586574 [Auriscalpium vulgare]|uniref:Uncharacterized protein n=1 Tax=Auriscalpium vulgare TaxID=40419 RepID=A0ACB8S979_9AGAM|nr:hypothetical protein FA95DRAFT_1586574 [Auriscalpium vulgare]